MLYIILVICVLGTIYTPCVFAQEVQVSSSRDAVKFSVAEYAAAAKPSSVGEAYTSFNKEEWFEYKIKIQVPGNYYIGMYASHIGATVTFAVSVDGEKVGEGILTPNGSWTDFSTLTELANYSFSKGTHTVRITNLHAGVHIKHFEIGGISEGNSNTDFSRKSGAYKKVYLPSIINAEEYDIGSEAGLSNDGINSGVTYRKEDPLDVFYKTGSESDYYLRLNMFESANYTFSVINEEIFAMTLKASGIATIYVYLDDMPYPLIYNFSSRDYTRTIPVNIRLSAGEHKIKVECAKNLVCLDSITFSTVQNVDEYLTEESFMSEIGEIVDETKTTEEPDYDSLDAPNEIYKEIYVAPNGNDSLSGEKDAPFATVERALKEVASSTKDMTGDIVVNFASGHYSIDETQKLSNEHGGKNGYNVIFRGEDENNKPVLSGGQKVTGWKKHNELIWRAPVSGVDEVRNLYVNDYPAVRARSKYKYVFNEVYKVEGSKYRQDGIITNSGNFPEFSQPQYLETYWPIVWKLMIHPVADIKEEDGKTTIIMDQPGWNYYSTMTNQNNPHIGSTFYLVNAMELLDEPGEFYYNKDDGFVYYYPYKAEDMSTAETYIGKTEILFDIKGSSKDNKLTNIVFDNIAFRHGAWDEVSKVGITMRQSDESMDLERRTTTNEDGTSVLKSPGQVCINNAENISITNCDFACIGSSALQFTDSVKNVKIEGNLLRDVNGAGVIIGAPHHSTADGKLEKTNTETCKNFMIRNNVFTRIAYEYQHQTAISVYYEANINIINNDISHTPYSGISAGWGWEDTKGRSEHHKNIKIMNNHIYGCMENLIDGGPIYTLGNLGGGEIAYNYIEHTDSMYGAIYLDAGSSEEVVHHNVIENVQNVWLVLQNGYAAKDDFIFDNYSNSSNLMESGNKDNTVYEEPYILEDGNYPQEAINIMNEAGLESEYKYLLDKAKLPSWMEAVNLRAPKQVFVPEANQGAKFGWIQAEDYIQGKQGETYYDTKNQVYNNPYRAEGVGLLKTSFKAGEYEGYVVHECSPGEWMTYKVRIPEDGEYTFKVNAAHSYAKGSKFNLYVDDVLVIENGIVQKGDLNWSEMVVTSFDGIYMTAGEHIVKYEYSDSGHYLDAIGFFSDKIPPDEEVDPNKDSPDYDEGIYVYEQEISGFEDISGHYAEADIIAMENADIINGVDEKTFAPEGKLTKEQTVWICMRAANIPFTMNNWKNVAFETGMIFDDADYDGSQPITREEFAHILMCAYRSIHGNIDMSTDILIEEISKEYYEDVIGAYKLGLLKGDTNGLFRPKDGLTRAEAAVAAKRLLELSK